MKLKTIPLIASISLVVLGMGIFGSFGIHNKLLDLRFTHPYKKVEPAPHVPVPISKGTFMLLLAVGVIGALSVPRKDKAASSTSHKNASQIPDDLKFNPFCKPIDMTYFWFGQSQMKTLDTLRKAVWGDANIIILTGRPGVGKTTLIKYLQKDLLPEYISVEANNEFLDTKDLFMLMAAQTGMNMNFKSKGAFFVRFNQYLHNLQAENKKILLILDNFYAINDNLIKELTSLSNIRIRHQKIIKILISGDNRSFRPSKLHKQTDISVVSCRLKPLNRNETKSYIDYLLAKVGTENRIFPHKTIENIFLHSQGVPGDINKICDCALNLGDEQKLRTIAPEIIEQCCQELNLLKGRQTNIYANIPRKIEPARDLSDNFFNGFTTRKLFDSLKNFADINRQWAINEFTKAVDKSHLFIQSAAKNFYFKQWNNWQTKISISRLFNSYFWNSLFSVSSVTLALAFALWYQGIFPFNPDAAKSDGFQKMTYSPEMAHEIVQDSEIIKSMAHLNISVNKHLSADQKLSDVNSPNELKSKLIVNEPESAEEAYFVQVGAFLIKENAINTVRTLNKKGYLAEIVNFTDSKDQLWHTVRIGEYASLKDAKKHAAEFSNQEKRESIVLPLNQP